MRRRKPKVIATPRSFATAVVRDTRGNTPAIITMVPLAGLIGGGIGISRMYITRTRLQHARDAGSPPDAAGCLRNLNADRRQ